MTSQNLTSVLMRVADQQITRLATRTHQHACVCQSWQMCETQSAVMTCQRHEISVKEEQVAHIRQQKWQGANHPRVCIVP